MSGFWSDIKFGFRMVIKSPGYAAVVILTLAVGIGVNTTAFSFVNGVLFKPLPYDDIERIVYIDEHIPSYGYISVSAPDYRDWKERSRSYESLSAFQFSNMTMMGSEYHERIEVGMVTSDFFTVMGGKTVLGRLFTEEEDTPSAARTVVLSYHFWQEKFGGNEDVIGSTIRLDEREYTVTGVTEREFNFPPYGIDGRDVWVPLGLFYETGGMINRGNHGGLYALGKLKENVTKEQAQAELTGIAEQLEKEYPDTNAQCGVRLRMLQDRLFEGVSPEMLYVLMAAVGFVLLIVCANVTNIALAKSTARTREIAVRSALGAGRGRIIRQLLCETVSLVTLGAGLGTLFTVWGLDWFVTKLPQQAQGVREAIALDGRVLGYTVLVSALTVAVFGLLPALQVSNIKIHHTLKEGGRSGGSSRRDNRLRKFLVASEVCAALALLCGSGLMIRSFINILNADMGVDARNVLMASVSLPEVKYSNDAQINVFYDEMLREVRSLPGVRYAAVTSPFLGGSSTSFYVEGQPVPEKGSVPSLDFTSVTPDYFDVLKLRLLAGRVLTADDRAGGKSVAVIDETMAEQYWGVTEAIGKRFMLGSENNPPYEVIGVVNHVKNYGVDRESKYEIYIPMEQSVRGSSVLLIRTESEPTTLTGALRETVKRIDSSIPLTKVQRVEDFLSGRSTPNKIVAAFMTFFATAALLLAAFGIYGVTAYSVSQRTQEIGIRMALGARMMDVISMVLGQGMRVVFAGIIAGLVLSIVLTRLMKSLLFQVSAYDPITFILVTLVLVGTAMLAGLLPALRASKVDPVKAIRYE